MREAHVSAEQPEAEKNPWVPRPNAEAGRRPRPFPQTPQGAQAHRRLSRGRRDGSHLRNGSELGVQALGEMNASE